MISFRSLSPALLAMLWIPGAVVAQFQIPLPPHASPDRAYHIYSAVCDSVRKNTGRIIATLQTTPRFTRRGSQADSMAVSQSSCSKGEWLDIGQVFGSPEAVREIYGPAGLDVLGDIASTFKSDQLFVQSSIVAGAIGPVYFKASYGQLFGSEEPEDGSVTREELRDRSSNLLRLIQNGGSATARVIVPVLWGGGAASQQAIGAYFNAGVVGPLGESDSLRGTVGVAIEGLASFAIRNVISYDLDADLFFGVRPGFQFVFGPGGIIPEDDSRALPFAQFAGGLRVGGKSLLSVFLTWVPKAYRDFVPDVQLSVQVPQL